MANCHNLFEEFDGNISIIQTKQDRMITSRDHERQLIRDHFAKEHPNYKPQFYIQGSNKMKTGIRTKYDECDVDDGVYFFRKPGVEPATLQGWVKDALVGVNDSSVEHKRKCVRTTYKAGYQIDRPVYCNPKDEPIQLAIKGLGWREDDPKAMVVWFKGKKKNKPDLVKHVKFSKAWCDHVREYMPSGLAMSILISNAEEMVGLNTRHDIAFLDLIKQIKTELLFNFKCIVPVAPKDDLFKSYDESRKQKVLKNLDELIEDGEKALKEKNQLKASQLWKKHLGRNFPLGEDKDEMDMLKEKAAAIITNSNSKPFGF
jgi:hypothetical protein